MTPSNPSNNKPLIYRIFDSLGVAHLVAAFDHTHSQSEVDGLVSALAGKQATLTFDNEPTSGSNNPVKSGGIFTAIANAVANRLAKLTSFTTGNFVSVKSDGTLEDSGKSASDFQTPLTFDSTPTANSTNPVTSGGVAAALENDVWGIINKYGTSGVSAYGTASEGYVEIVVTKNDAETGVDITYESIDNLKRALLDPDSVPTIQSDRLITSEAVFAALNNKKSIFIDSDHYVSVEVAYDSTRHEMIILQVGDKAAIIDKSNIAKLNRILNGEEVIKFVSGQLPYDTIDLDEIFESSDIASQKVILLSQCQESEPLNDFFAQSVNRILFQTGTIPTIPTDNFVSLNIVKTIDTLNNTVYLVSIDGIFDYS